MVAAAPNGPRRNRKRRRARVEDRGSYADLRDRYNIKEKNGVLVLVWIRLALQRKPACSAET